MDFRMNNFIQRIVVGTGLILFFLSVNTCTNESLKVTDPNRLTPDTFWQSGEDAEQAIVGAYGPLTTIQGWGRMLGAILTIHRSDIVDTNPQPNVYDIGTFTLTPNDARVNEGWSELNAIVARTNQVLENVPNIEMDETRKSEIMGEAYFLRGFAHFYLVNMWRNIPLLTTAITSADELNVEQADPSAVWDNIISDFTEAQSRLPDEWPESDVGRATWGAATAMLGKAYLYQENWSSAAVEFKKVMDSGLYELVDNYQDNFMAETNNNAESVFELQYQSTPNGNWGRSGTPNPMRGQAWEPDIAPPGFTSQQSVTINDWVFDLFTEEQTNAGETDPRAYATLLWNYPDAKVYQENFDEAFSGDNLNKVFVRKYLNFDRTSSLTPGSWAYSDNNRRMIRYADVLLMYAEAENEAKGPSSAVYDAINQVRQRVNMPDIQSGLNQSQLRQEIRDERVLELALEGDRVLDLLRWGVMADRFTNNPELRENAGMNFQAGKHEYLPIPQQDMDSNPKLVQNPGY
ncbi:RagB/SusD family nutrient uptake outer membrane protein [Halalkalibaculum sp. DA384]|uniref:RagB/SusD family nutrient uptake outer membrane protein n=1 Tax=Halalkalibaculum sp. DA384 TaxID=3373606 RepID=UPI0037553FF5